MLIAIMVFIAIIFFVMGWNLALLSSPKAGIIWYNIENDQYLMEFGDESKKELPKRKKYMRFKVRKINIPLYEIK